MWTDAARTASIATRAGSNAMPNVAAQGAAAQRAMVGASRPAPGGGGGSAGGGRGGSAGGAAGGGRGQPARAAAPAHGSGVAAIAPRMNGGQPPGDTRPNRTAIDRAASAGARASTDRNSGEIDNLSARYSQGSMAGDHTTPPELQKYLN